MSSGQPIRRAIAKIIDKNPWLPASLGVLAIFAGGKVLEHMSESEPDYAATGVTEKYLDAKEDCSDASFAPNRNHFVIFKNCKIKGLDY